MKAIQEFVAKCHGDGKRIAGKYDAVKRVIFNSPEYPVKFIEDYSADRQEKPVYNGHEHRLILPLSLEGGKIVINIVSEVCEERTIYDASKSE